MDIKAASRVGSGRAHPGPLAPDCILLGSVVCCSDRPDLSLGENLCVFRSAKFCSDPGRSAKFTANIQDLNISDPVIIGCNSSCGFEAASEDGAWGREKYKSKNKHIL